jgi:hypothetical protein
VYFDTASIVGFHSDTLDNALSSDTLEYDHRFLAIVIEAHGVESEMLYRFYWSID